MNSNKVLVTGAAGFIGYHVCKKLLEEGFFVIGIDNLNSYYDIDLKNARLEDIEGCIERNKASWIFYKIDIANKESLIEVFDKFRPKIVINLAAQAGVRYSISNPDSYINSNIVGFTNILECCRNFEVTNFLYASSSSVYGGNTKIPFSEKDSTNHPISLYAATKCSNELIAHSYSHLYGIPSTGLRFFTVYGPWGRPDMAPMKFTKMIFEKKEIEVFNYGKMSRSFTYIDDVSEIIKLFINKPAAREETFNTENPNSSISWAPHKIFNIGNPKNINLLDFIEILEKEIGITAIKKFIPMQAGDVVNTSADCELLEKYLGIGPLTTIDKGVKKFISWYKYFYNLN